MPTELGLFPLNIVLLPGERVPLHIFEERYKALISECLEQSTSFGLVHAGEAGLSPIGTTAAVTEVLNRYEDGRLDIVVEGRDRFRVETLTEGRSWLTAEVEPVPDVAGDPQPEVVEHCVEAYRALADLAGADAGELDLESSTLSYAIAARIEFEAELKQELLELTDEPGRLERLTELLVEAGETLKRRDDIRRRALGNGRVDHL